jgi:hypothetical protein
MQAMRKEEVRKTCFENAFSESTSCFVWSC